MDKETFKQIVISPRGLNTVYRAANDLTETCHGITKKPEWRNNVTTGEPLKRKSGELLILCVSELTKAANDERLSHRCGLEVKLANCVMHIFHMASGLGLDVAGAVVEKLECSATRKDNEKKY